MACRHFFDNKIYAELKNIGSVFTSTCAFTENDVKTIEAGISSLPKELRNDAKQVFKKIKKFKNLNKVHLFRLSSLDAVVKIFETYYSEDNVRTCSHDEFYDSGCDSTYDGTRGCSDIYIIDFESLLTSFARSIGMDSFKPQPVPVNENSFPIVHEVSLENLTWRPRGFKIADERDSIIGPYIKTNGTSFEIRAKFGDGVYEFLNKKRIFIYSHADKVLRAQITKKSELELFLLIDFIANENSAQYTITLDVLTKIQYITPEYLENKKKEEEEKNREQEVTLRQEIDGLQHQLNLFLCDESDVSKPGTIYLKDNTVYVKPVYGDDVYSILKNSYNFSYNFEIKAVYSSNAMMIHKALQFIQENHGDYKITVDAMKEYQNIAEKYIEDNKTFELSWATDSDLEFPVPEGLSYREYQKAGIAYSLQRKNVLLGDDMGLGKTIQIIGIINADPNVETALIICPASLRSNWNREIRKWLTKDLSIGVAKDEWPDTQVVIIGYNTLKKFHVEIRDRNWDLLAADECQYIKNPKTQRTIYVMGGVPAKSSIHISKIAANRTIFASGTPFENKPREIFPIANFLDPITFDSEKKFLFRYCGPKNDGYGYSFNGASNVDELNELLRKNIMIRRMKADVLGELPPVEHQIIYIDEIDEFKTELINPEPEVIRGTFNLKTEMDKLSRVKIDFDAVARTWHNLGLKKVKYAIESLETLIENGKKVLCFCHHQDVVKAIHKHFKDKSVLLTGKVTKDRSDIVDKFQTDDSIRLFCGTIGASGVGHTLTAATVAFFAELSPVPGRMNQAIDRMNRIGQASNKLNAYYLVVPGTYDENIVLTFTTKQMNFDAVNNERLAFDDLAEGELAIGAAENQYETKSILSMIEPIENSTITYAEAGVEETESKARTGRGKSKKGKTAAGPDAETGTEREDVEGFEDEEGKRERTRRSYGSGLGNDSVLDAVSKRLAEIERISQALDENDLRQIHASIKTLANYCDGAREKDKMGFNASDTNIGRHLAELETLTCLEGFTALEILYKYIKQLSSYNPGYVEDMEAIYEKIRNAR